MGCDDKRVRKFAAIGRGSPNVLTIELADDDVFQATAIGAANWDEVVLTDEEFEDLGPSIVDLVIHGEGTNLSQYFNYQVQLQYRGKTGAWVDGGAVLPTQNSGTYVISSAFSDRSKFGRRIRLVLRTQITTGQTGTQKGLLSLLAAIRLYQG